MNYHFGLLEELCLNHYQYTCKERYCPNKVHKYGNHLLKFLLDECKLHESFKTDFCSSQDPNAKLNQKIKVLHLLISDIQYFLCFPWCRFRHLLATFHIIDVLAVTKLLAITIFLSEVLLSLRLFHIWTRRNLLS